MAGVAGDIVAVVAVARAATAPRISDEYHIRTDQTGSLFFVSSGNSEKSAFFLPSLQIQFYFLQCAKVIHKYKHLADWLENT